MNRSPLHHEHVALGASMIEFAGWEMPVRYAGDVAEHQAVRRAAGLFDISHMGQVAVRGGEAAAALDEAVVSGMARLAIGRAKYTMLCMPDGGIIDDLIVYRRDWDHFIIVANAANVGVVVSELRERCSTFEAVVEDVTHLVSLQAVQGPRAMEIVTQMCALGAEDVRALKNYTWCTVLLHGDIHAMVARTGYTGEDGFELFVMPQDAVEVWRLALATGSPFGLIPCGLSARDTLRLEAGMPLYGQELTRSTTPYTAGLGWVVQTAPARELRRPGLDGAVGFTEEPVERGDFVGRKALAAAKQRHDEWASDPALAPADARVLVGLVGDSRRAARPGYAVMMDDREVGVVTSGAPSPTLSAPIAMALVHPSASAVGTAVQIDVRGRRETMTVSALPFYSRAS
ncbi:glycine cleavage system aminomethyltransferase GcvT [Demequina sp. TTPB684]|uniref:glycine cleavage system aminomethyltransferase GcvT n=1 Tax=unclassified Demequina TaxID=2620311 RepID=UPI001CF38C04|nr:MULTISPECIES: glycine cleavage system aminomethyltransferase GcvT [unclassified Demequina]MCB2412721.1 glycine cleavage system aminomethyltransferase GcvT [Demequina sp. TTPB684]UPU87844.1 glycine cleavage system aminomethyltransferase GcvT [Demequina sp. TMPB413]